MANIDTLTEGLYKLIHKLAGDSTTTDAQIEEALDNMTFVQACDKLIEEVEDGDLSIASGASTLATLNDTTITSATDGQVLKYNGSKWVNADDTDTDELDDLSDVALTAPSNGQVLTYDGTAEKWKNADASGGGGVFLVTATNSGGTYSVDKTSAEIYEAFENGMLPLLIDASGFVFHLTKAVESLSYPQIRFEQTYADEEGVTTESYNIAGGSDGDTVTHETATFVGSVE